MHRQSIIKKQAIPAINQSIFNPNIIHLGPTYFIGGYEISKARMDEVTRKAKSLPRDDKFGNFIDAQHYLDAVDLLLASTLEAEHRNEILERSILPSLRSFNSMLDIGVGNGQLTKFIGQYYNNITVVDNSEDALNNVADYHSKNGSKVDKIYGSVLDVEIPYKSYDMIVLSHVIYYIDPAERSILIDKLYNLLSDNGVILIVFNEGGNRYQLTNEFDGTHFEFSGLISDVSKNYPETTIIEFDESIQTNSIESALQIAGVCLKDASTTASEYDLIEYLRSKHYDDNMYTINMVQKIILIGETLDV
jgi:2-polyprenyl-3-methyl-5-hydroxy-6-metoxy-1,4-benzoquinol methylase